MPGKPDLVDPEYLDTPYLTLAVNFCLAFGLFIGAWTVISLIANLRRGVGTYWPLILILVIDVTLNVVLRLIRARKRALDADAPGGNRVAASRRPGTPSNPWRDLDDERRT
jgi:hypothetical protein